MATSLHRSWAPNKVQRPGGLSIHLGQYDVSQLQGLIGKAAWTGIDDISMLPVKLWVHAHYYGWPGMAVLWRVNFRLREAGYVFWDGCMGETAEMLERMETWTWSFRGRLLPHELPGLRHDMRESWKTRREIWLKGGRGYWAEGDERKVMYEDLQQEDLCDPQAAARRLEWH